MAKSETGSHSAAPALEAGWMAHMVFAYEGSAPTEERLSAIKDFIHRAGTQAVEPTVLFKTDGDKTEALIDMGAEADDNDIEGALAYGLRVANSALQSLGLRNEDIELVEGVPAPMGLVNHNQGLQPRPEAHIPGFYNGQFFPQSTARAVFEDVRQEIEIEQLEQAFLL